MTNLSFENDSFVIEGSKERGCLLSFKIKIKPALAQKDYKKAVKLVNKQISIPGFRKGHAPDATVISRYASYVEREWKEMLVNDAYRAVVDFSKIYPLTKESIQKPKIEKLSLEEGALVLLSYEYYPEVPSIDFSSISIPKINKEKVTDEQVQDVLEEVRRGQASFETIEGRSVEEGDYVDISIDAIDQDPPKSIVKDRRFEVKEKRMAPWLVTLLIGLKIGESIEGLSELDESASAEVKKKFQPTKVKVTLHAIKKILLPEIDDEFAKKVGASSKEDLIEKIRHNLEKRAEDELYNKQIEAMENALLDKYLFDIPSSLVESEKKERIKSQIQALKSENLSDEEIQARSKEIEEMVSSEIERSYRLYFLNKQIARQGNISLTNQELNDEIVAQVSQNPQFYGREMDKETSKDLVSKLASQLMQRKAKDYALSQVIPKQPEELDLG